MCVAVRLSAKVTKSRSRDTQRLPLFLLTQGDDAMRTAASRLPRGRVTYIATPTLRSRGPIRGRSAEASGGQAVRTGQATGKKTGLGCWGSRRPISNALGAKSVGQTSKIAKSMLCCKQSIFLCHSERGAKPGAFSLHEGNQAYLLMTMTWRGKSRASVRQR